jgi:subtilisin family serine protease
VLAINALAVWGAYGARGAGTKVAVLDTGVDDTHPDLQGKISDWAEFDENGQPVSGSQPHDSDRHGTHVAGTVAGDDASASGSASPRRPRSRPRSCSRAGPAPTPRCWPA